MSNDTHTNVSSGKYYVTFTGLDCNSKEGGFDDSPDPRPSDLERQRLLERVSTLQRRLRDRRDNLPGAHTMCISTMTYNVDKVCVYLGRHDVDTKVIVVTPKDADEWARLEERCIRIMKSML